MPVQARPGAGACRPGLVHAGPAWCRCRPDLVPVQALPGAGAGRPGADAGPRYIYERSHAKQRPAAEQR